MSQVHQRIVLRAISEETSTKRIQSVGILEECLGQSCLVGDLLVLQGEVVCTSGLIGVHIVEAIDPTWPSISLSTTQCVHIHNVLAIGADF